LDGADVLEDAPSVAGAAPAALGALVADAALAGFVALAEFVVAVLARLATTGVTVGMLLIFMIVNLFFSISGSSSGISAGSQRSAVIGTSRESDSRRSTKHLLRFLHSSR
jgi:mannose/fructose/N-acetylgalactosamine-specific phosphotransferase system component IID